MRNRFLSKIESDKWRHVYVGILMGIFLECTSYYFLDKSYLVSIATSTALIIIISYGFELFSLVSGLGHYDFKDAIASMIGGFIGLGLGLLALMLFTT